MRFGVEAKDFWDRALVHGALVGDLHSGWWKLLYIPHHEQVRICFFLVVMFFDTFWYTYIYFALECFLHIQDYISIVVLDPHEAYVPVAVPLWSVRQDDKSIYIYTP